MLAIVLRRHDFREADQIISLYTREVGKREALARGVKKITSKNSGSLEPFSVIEAEIIPGKEIDHIGSVQIIELFKNIRSDFDKMVLAQRAVSLIEQLFSNSEPDTQSFNVIYSWFQALDQSSSASPILLAAFMMKLLSRLGFAPELENCSGCGRSSSLPLSRPLPTLPLKGEGDDSSPPFKEGTGGVVLVAFDIPAGGVVCAECRAKPNPSEQLLSLTPGTLQALRTIITADWNQIFPLILDKKDTDELHKFVHRFAVFHSGKKLKEWRS